MIFQCLLSHYFNLFYLIAFTATRSTTHGSFFVRILVATFYKHSSHRDVEKLFKIVSFNLVYSKVLSHQVYVYYQTFSSAASDTICLYLTCFPVYPILSICIWLVPLFIQYHQLVSDLFLCSFKTIYLYLAVSLFIQYHLLVSDLFLCSSNTISLYLTCSSVHSRPTTCIWQFFCSFNTIYLYLTCSSVHPIPSPCIWHAPLFIQYHLLVPGMFRGSFNTIYLYLTCSSVHPIPSLCIWHVPWFIQYHLLVPDMFPRLFNSTIYMYMGCSPVHTRILLIFSSNFRI